MRQKPSQTKHWTRSFLSQCCFFDHPDKLGWDYSIGLGGVMGVGFRRLGLWFRE